MACEIPPAAANHPGMSLSTPRTDPAMPMADSTRQAFADQLERHRGILAKVAGTYAWHPEDRAELAQEIALQLWRAWPAYDPARPFSTWMYRIALNVAITQVRVRGRQPAPEASWDPDRHDVADPNAHDHEAAEQVRLLHRFIHAQPPLERALLLLYLDQRGQREIAEVLGISETNVSTKLGRLKARLRNEL